MSAPVVLLVNPAAGRGRAAQVAARAERALRSLGLTVEPHATRERGDETRVAAAASAAGARALAVVGGDGSISHAARGLMEGEAQGGARVPLAVFAAGTGNDFAKSLTVPVHQVDRMAGHVAAGRTHDVDVGFVNDVPFVNAAGFGFDVAVLERMQSPGLLRGTAAYVSTALGALCGYRGVSVGLGGADPAHRLMLVFANGQYFGGAFRIAPHAQLADGALDCIAIHHVAPLARLPLFARALRGAHLSSRHVSCHRDHRFQLHFEAPPRFETDGELHQAASRDVVVTMRSRALSVIG